MSRQQGSAAATEENRHAKMPNRRRGKFEVWCTCKHFGPSRWRRYEDRDVAEKAMAGFKAKYSFWTWEIRVAD